MNKVTPLGEILREYIEALSLSPKLKELELIRYWPELVGPRISNRTSNLKIKNKTLYIQANSSILKQEIMMIRSELVKRLNTKVGKEIISDICFY